MIDADRRTAALAAALDHLGWFKVPHTMDHVVGIYAEATAEQAGTRPRSMTNEEILASITSSTDRGGKGGHSDPTPRAALWGEPGARDDADGTMGAIDASLTDLEQSATALDHLVSDVTGRMRWHPPRLAGRQRQIATAASRLHHLSGDLTAACGLMDHHQLHDADGLLLTAITDQARWLHDKAEAIWLASRGETRTVAQQQPIAECQCCSPWRKGTIAPHGGLCEQCTTFKRNHQCLPIEPIVRGWELGRNYIKPEHMTEAKRQAKRKAKAS